MPHQEEDNKKIAFLKNAYRITDRLSSVEDNNDFKQTLLELRKDASLTIYQYNDGIRDEKKFNAIAERLFGINRILGNRKKKDYCQHVIKLIVQEICMTICLLIALMNFTPDIILTFCIGVSIILLIICIFIIEFYYLVSDDYFKIKLLYKITKYIIIIKYLSGVILLIKNCISLIIEWYQN